VVSAEGNETQVAQLIAAGGRFTIERRLGAGGMGVVYEAHDRERDARVALKTLRRVNPASIYRFKQEFRALADVTHPNLVTLYELLSVGDEWFFTMELVEGRDILSYVRGVTGPSEDASDPYALETATAVRATGPSPLQADQTAPTIDSPPSSSPGSDRIYLPAAPELVRPVLRQLAEAVSALHATGHLHRDIKPSNVLVTPQGRAVVLDYGVITEVAGKRRVSSLEQFVGTPAYAAPEQAGSDVQPSGASDWYSVGVILYEALTGRRPFVGSAAEILEAKRKRDAPAPSAIHPEVDPKLETLCVGLLRRNPEERPEPDVILSALGTGDRAATATGDEAARGGAQTGALVGRERQLGALREAFEESRKGAGVTVRIKGRSGMGKTALVEHFLAELSTAGRALVLAGRCYERESVPHEAIDGLVDALCRFLLGLPRAEADVLMPVDVFALSRAFPVLRRVEAVAKAQRRSTAAALDPVELRRRAFAALRELIARIAEQRPLVLFIDDLQWGDLGSAPFLADLMHEPAPPLLLVVAYRSEEAESSALLRSLFETGREGEGALAGSLEVPVGRLPLAEARQLAGSLLGPGDVAEQAAEKVARESGGNPYFVHELVRWVSSRGGVAETGPPSLAMVILARAETLSEEAARLLEVAAVYGKPMTQAVARRAAEIGRNHPRAVAELRSAHLVRTTGARAGDMIEIFHSRIGEAVVSRLEQEALRGVHRRIAAAIEASDARDHEALATHYAAAGEWEPAREYAVLAGDRAADALAFERAAAHYRVALELTQPEEHAAVFDLGRKLGDALVNAGRGAEAAEPYIWAASVAEPQHALELQVRAGSELLRSGHVDEGMEVIEPALASVGLKLARTPARALFSLLARRAYMRIRGLGFRERTEAQIAPETLARIDAYNMASTGLGMADTLRGADVQTRHLLLALRRGDSVRAARGLAFEAAYLCLGGLASKGRVDRALSLTNEVAERYDHAYLRAMRAASAGLAAYQRGEWGTTLEETQTAERLLREQCIGVAFELASVQLYRIWALFWFGEFREMSSRVREAVNEARSRGDLYTEVSLSVGLPSFRGLVADDPKGTQGMITEASARWSARGYHLQHYWRELGLAQCELYGGRPEAVLERFAAQWPAMKKVFFHRIEAVRTEVTFLQARSALAAAGRGDDADRLLKRAARHASRLAREKPTWCAAGADLVRAGIRATQGRSADAIALLERSEARFREANSFSFATAAQWRRGQLVGGEQGKSLVDAAVAWMNEREVRNPERMLAFFAPGFDAAAAK